MNNQGKTIHTALYMWILTIEKNVCVFKVKRGTDRVKQSTHTHTRNKQEK